MNRFLLLFLSSFLFTSARPGNLVSYLSPNLTTDDDSFDSTSTNAVNLLPDTAFGHKKTLVLDLDGTLIYATDVLVSIVSNDDENCSNSSENFLCFT